MSTHVCSSLKDSLWPCDTIWQHKSGSTLAQVMAWCLTAPSHYLNQCWPLINEILWHSSESNCTASAQVINLYHKFKNHTFKIIAYRGQWVKGDFIIMPQHNATWLEHLMAEFLLMLKVNRAESREIMKLKIYNVLCDDPGTLQVFQRCSWWMDLQSFITDPFIKQHMTLFDFSHFVWCCCIV